ncbi:putative pentatricopeptide repeat-containing protein At3g13770, mitochondrial [Wolffia australiana]
MAQRGGGGGGRMAALHGRLVKTRDPLALRDVLLLASGAPLLLRHALSLFPFFAPQSHAFPWNALLRALSFSPFSPLPLFPSMLRHGPLPDLHTLPPLLRLSPLPFGLQLHALALKLSLAPSSLPTSNSLVSFYSRHLLPRQALRAFLDLPSPDLVSFSALASSSFPAIAVLRAALARGFQLDAPAMAVFAKSVDSPDLAFWVLAYSLRHGLLLYGPLGTAVVAALARSGLLALARKVFDEMPSRSLQARTALLMGLAAHGREKEAVEIFQGARSDGWENDHVAFIGALSACSRAGLLDEGATLFAALEGGPTVEHYGCMVDLLGRAGLVREAYGLVSRIPGRGSPIVWRTLLWACVAHGYVVLAEQVRAELARLDPDNDGDDVLLSNAYGGIGRWEGKAEVRAHMARRGVKKIRGSSIFLPN